MSKDTAKVELEDILVRHKLDWLVGHAVFKELLMLNHAEAYKDGQRDAFQIATRHTIAVIEGFKMVKTEGLYDNEELFIKRAPLMKAWDKALAAEKEKLI